MERRRSGKDFVVKQQKKRFGCLDLFGRRNCNARYVRNVALLMFDFVLREKEIEKEITRDGEVEKLVSLMASRVAGWGV